MTPRTVTLRSPSGRLGRRDPGMLLENTHRGCSMTVMPQNAPNHSLSIETTENLAYLLDLK